MSPHRRTAVAAALIAAVTVTLASIPVAATAATPAPPSDNVPASDTATTTSESVVSCSDDGFTGTLHVLAKNDPANHEVTFTVTSVKIDPAPGSGGRNEADLEVYTMARSLVPQDDDNWDTLTKLSSTLMQDGQEHAVDLPISHAAGSPRNYLATYVFSFDAAGADPSCTTNPASLLVAPSPPSPGASCSLNYVAYLQACWRAQEDSIVTIDVTSANVDMPEYLLLNPDYTIDHRGRFTEGTSSRVFLLAGQSLALTPSRIAASPNTIHVRSVRPLADGLQPEVGEQCVASSSPATACFVVAPRNYRIHVRVTHTPFGTAPEYYVTDAKTGKTKHGGRLELNGLSTTWIDAGDQFWLTRPLLSGDKNAVVITDVQPYQ